LVAFVYALEDDGVYMLHLLDGAAKTLTAVLFF
jgi:hypothetical protein